MPLSIAELTGRYKSGSRDSLLPLLQDIQDEFGFLNEEAVIAVSRHLQLPASKIYGIATFYNQFRFVQRGKFHLILCNGTSCHMNGSRELSLELQKKLKIKPGHTTRDGLFSLEEVSCIGACGQGPVMAVGDDFHTSMTPDKVEMILRKYRNMS